MKRNEELKSLLKQAKDLKGRAEKLETSRGESAEEQTIKNISGGNPMSHPVVGGTSDEKRAMALYKCSSVQELLQKNIGAPEFRKMNARHPELPALVMELKKSVDTARMIAQLFHGAPGDQLAGDAPRLGNVKNILETPFGRDDTASRLKSFSSTVAADGGAFVPRLISSSYVEEYELDFVVEEKFRKIRMESATYDLPIIDGVTKARKIDEKTQISDTNFNTDQITFTATKFGEHYCIPEELSEDSAPDILGAAREEVVRAQIRAIEAAILNGDATGAHIDSDTDALGADVAEKQFDGLRQRALASAAANATTDFAGSGVTEALLRTLRARMGKFGSLPSDLLIIAGPVVYVQMQDLPSVKTIDVFGPNATIQRGVLANYAGIPVVNSEFMREDLNASGVYDGVTIDKAGLIIVNTRRFYCGERRPIQVKIMQDLPYHDRLLMASYQRKDFQGHAQDANEVSISYGYNIQV